MFSARYLKKCFVSSHQIWYTEAPWQGKDTSNPVSLTLFSRSRMSFKFIYIGFRLISEETFDAGSLNLVHRGTRARQRTTWNVVTLTSFSRSRRSFKVIKNGFCSISEMFYKLSPNLVHRGPHGKAKTKFESCDIDLIFKVTKFI